jgi:5'-nucleotidase
MRILVTNDDGILAPGLDSLARVAERFGETWVVAPDVERSGVSHAITLTEPLRACMIAPRRYALTGTPADCVFIALNHLLPEKPDLVLSGINRGPNLGYDVLYSGTVGGAMEGTIQGIPAVAFSLVGGGSFDFRWAEEHVGTVIEDVISNGMPEGVTLNVNLPDPSIADFRGFKLVRLGHRHYSGDVIAREDPRGGEYLWIGGTRITMDTGQDTDCGVVHSGFASVTPLRPDMMAREAMPALARYDELGRSAHTES